MSVYKKLQEARIMLQRTKLSKSGKNKFAGYEYFELGDFLPAIQEICHKVGLCGVVSFNHEMAFLQISDVEDGTSIMFTSPMSSASLKGCHDVQNLGAVQTYLRRYLWTNAFEIVEHDALDAVMGKDEPAKKSEAVAVKPVVATTATAKSVSKGWTITVQSEGSDQDWLETLKAGCDALLQIAEKEEDVLDIFKVNRTTFEKAKKLDEKFYSNMMAKFTEVRQSFKKEK
jgi:hypothetical protein